MADEKKPGRPEDRLKIEDAGEALDALLGKRGEDAEPCSVCVGVKSSSRKEPAGLELVSDDGFTRANKHVTERTTWRCSACGATWKRIQDSGKGGHDLIWLRQ